jgi:hypothetical protein
MKTLKFLLFAVLALSMGMACSENDMQGTDNVTAQEYYYWNKGKKIPLELLPTKKYILVNSSEDTTVLKERLALKDIMAHPFRIDKITYAQDMQDKIECWTIVEGIDLVPDLTDDETILYEGPFFLNADKLEVGGLSHTFLVKLKQIEDLPLLKELAENNGVIIDGQVVFSMPLWYSLSCTKTSTGNAMQMANMFYETTLFASSVPGFSNIGLDVGIDNLQDGDIMISAANSVIYINTPKTESIRIYSLTGSLMLDYEN